jgi:AcrR family transcriptional regulator
MQKRASDKTAAELLGVPVLAPSGRERIVDIAIELFYRHGFNAVGVDRILDEAGVTKTTFYKHFESKEDLMEQAVRKRDRWEGEAWARACREIGGDDPRAQLLALFDVLHKWFNEPDFRGCIFINTAAEFPNPHDPVHKAAAEHKRQTRDAIRDMAKRAGTQDAETFADQYTLLLEGTLIMRQIHGRNDAATMARSLAERLIDQHMPPSRS